MRWIFLAPFVVLSSFCFGQVPYYVPQDGLISWHNLDGDAEASFGPYEGALSGTIPALNRHGEEAMALRFEDGDHVALGSYAELQGSCEFTVSTWFNADASNEGHNMLWCSGLNHWLLNFTSSDDIVIDTGNYCNQQYTSGNTLQNDEWHHVVTVLSNGLVTVLVDNEIYATLEVNTCMCSHPYTMMLATMDGYPHNFVGSLDEFGTWNRALENWEIDMLYSEVLPGLGCSDETACNYDSNATIDDGSCDYFTCLCLDGTVWSEELGGCIPATTCPQDLDYDGVVGVNDLMNLLSAFGTPCEPLVAEWTCGDPVSYHGYDYETVLIGEQCWFAENLRTFMYRNGDEIPLPISDEEWTMLEDTGDGGMAYPNESVGALNEFGALYNWNAVIDNRQLCPQGWHIPSHIEWGQMETFAGMEFSESLAWQHNYGNVGDAIKSAEWNCPAWNGQNAFGFSALPAGYRANGGYDSFGSIGYLWSSSSLADLDWSSQEDHGVFRFVTETGSYWFYDTLASGSNIGISVRCIKD